MKKLILASVFLALFSLFIKPPTDPDLFWHLRYGEEILKTRQFPYADQFSFTLPGYRAADSWWLSEVLIYYLVSKIGFLGSSLIFGLLGAVIYLLVGLGARINRVNVQALAVASFLGAIVAYPILGLRPQTISFVGIGLVFILLHQFWLKSRPRLIYFLPLVFLFWANFHAGFTLGLALIWLFWGLEAGRVILQKLFKNHQLTLPSLSLSQLKIIFSVNVISTLVTLINPYGIGLWQTVLNDASSQTIKNHIAEWASPNFHSEGGLLYFFYLLLSVFFVYWGKVKVHPTRFLILLFFCLLSLAAVRHISIFVLLATPFLAEAITALSTRLSRSMANLRFPYKKLALVLFFFFFSLAWAFLFLPPTLKANYSLEELASAGKYPYKAVEYLKGNPSKRMLSEYGWGGYLIWQLPQSKTFIDGRMPGWKKDGREIMDDYDKLANLKKEAPELLDFWQIETVLLPPDYPLLQYLKIHPGWEKKYEDKEAVVFVRK